MLIIDVSAVFERVKLLRPKLKNDVDVGEFLGHPNASQLKKRGKIRPELIFDAFPDVNEAVFVLTGRNLKEEGRVEAKGEVSQEKSVDPGKDFAGEEMEDRIFKRLLAAVKRDLHGKHKGGTCPKNQSTF
jgi:hypothetical protein